MEFWTILIYLGIAYIIQMGLSMIQLRNFNSNFKKLRKQGRVAIGKKKGAFFAGAITMFSIDEQGMIQQGLYMSGISILARCKELNDFNGVMITEIREDQCRRFTKSLRMSIMNAVQNYQDFVYQTYQESLSTMDGKENVA